MGMLVDLLNLVGGACVIGSGSWTSGRSVSVSMLSEGGGAQVGGGCVLKVIHFPS